MMIFLTSIAAEEIKKIVSEQDDYNIDNAYLRVGVKGGGCSGYSYILDITEDYSSDKDLLFEIEGIRVICDDRSHLYLDGTKIDFKDEIMRRGFTFDNPNHSTCNCGSSFNV